MLNIVNVEQPEESMVNFRAWRVRNSGSNIPYNKAKFYLVLQFSNTSESDDI